MLSVKNCGGSTPSKTNILREFIINPYISSISDSKGYPINIPRINGPRYGELITRTLECVPVSSIEEITITPTTS